MICREYFYFSGHCLGDNFHFLSSNIFMYVWNFTALSFNVLIDSKGIRLVDLFQIASLYEKGAISENMKKKTLSLSKGLAAKHWTSLTIRLGIAASKPSVFK